MLFSRGALTANILAATASMPRRSVGGAARHHHPPLGRRDDDNSVALLLFRRYSPPPFLGASRAAVANRRSSSLLPPPSSTMQRLRGGGGGGLDDDSAAAERHRRRRGSSSGWRGAYLAVGSNLGDRYRNVADALSALESSGDVRILRTSYLRSTSPMYVTDQPPFLNGAVFVETRLCPIDLLRLLKRVESDLGRDVGGLGLDGGKKTERFGPRTIDLDILLYDGHHRDDDGDAIGDVVVDDGPPPATRRSSLVMRTEELEIPHPRMSEREFVLSPMRDLERSPHSGNDEEDENSIISHPVYNESMSMLLESLMNHRNGENKDGGDDNIDAVVAGGGGENVVGGDERAVRVLPLPRGRMLHLNETIIMGILNVTPDSFSDGGEHADSIESAARRAIRLEEDGAGIVDVGGESTRPGAEDVPVDVELGRTVPVIRRIRELGSDVAISIDTRSSVVASAAIEAGADVVNDVSGGSHDPGMLGVVASHGVPMIIMHMRGDPRTMTSLSDYDGCPGGGRGGGVGGAECALGRGGEGGRASVVAGDRSWHRLREGSRWQSLAPRERRRPEEVVRISPAVDRAESEAFRGRDHGGGESRGQGLRHDCRVSRLDPVRRRRRRRRVQYPAGAQCQGGQTGGHGL